MKLRRACLDDYDIIKKLYDDLSAEMIYVPDEPLPPCPDSEVENTVFFGCFQFTADAFKKDLEKGYIYYFVLIENNEIIGFFKTIKHPKSLRIGLWCMKSAYHHLKDKAWEKFLKTKEIRNKSKLSVLLFPSMVKSREWFESKGFYNHGPFMYYDKKREIKND